MNISCFTVAPAASPLWNPRPLLYLTPGGQIAGLWPRSDSLLAAGLATVSYPLVLPAAAWTTYIAQWPIACHIGPAWYLPPAPAVPLMPNPPAPAPAPAPAAAPTRPPAPPAPPTPNPSPSGPAPSPAAGPNPDSGSTNPAIIQAETQLPNCCQQSGI